MKGAELGHRAARWLAAAAHDRWLMRQGKPQKYGTQYVTEGDRWRLWEVDPATTDQERKEWSVPPLASGGPPTCRGDDAPAGSVRADGELVGSGSRYPTSLPGSSMAGDGRRGRRAWSRLSSVDSPQY